MPKRAAANAAAQQQVDEEAMDGPAVTYQETDSEVEVEDPFAGGFCGGGCQCGCVVRVAAAAACECSGRCCCACLPARRIGGGAAAWLAGWAGWLAGETLAPGQPPHGTCPPCIAGGADDDSDWEEGDEEDLEGTLGGGLHDSSDADSASDAMEEDSSGEEEE